MGFTRKIRVLIVDDSAFVRRIATETLNADPEIEVVGSAPDPYQARDRIKALSPDVLTLDLEMPRMDGLTFLRLLMEHRPMPVIVLSSLTQRGSDFAFEALRLGAVDVLGKPIGSGSFGTVGPKLISMVKAAAMARVRQSVATTQPSRRESLPVPLRHDRRACILLGASTGGLGYNIPAWREWYTNEFIPQQARKAAQKAEEEQAEQEKRKTTSAPSGGGSGSAK